MKLIAMLHLCPLEAFAAWNGSHKARYEANLADDLRALQRAGVRHLMVENNFDSDHGDALGDRAHAFEHLLDLVCDNLRGTGVTVGVCCRWADWRSTFRFVRKFDLAFCRLPLVGLRVTIRSGKTIETTFGEIAAGLDECGPARPIVLCDLIPKNCQIASMPRDLDHRVANLKACGGTGLVMGERRSGDYLINEDYRHIEACQVRWRLPAYVAGSIDDVRARALSERGVGAIVGGFIYRQGDQDDSPDSWPWRLDEHRLQKLITAVYG